jgi:hypothetical protein
MSRPKPKTQKQLEAQVADWNAKYKVGQLVRYYPTLGNRDRWETHTTSSNAYVLSGHTAVVHLLSKSGCVALDNLEAYAPVPEQFKKLAEGA